jgi:hypothetical protein
MSDFGVEFYRDGSAANAPAFEEAIIVKLGDAAKALSSSERNSGDSWRPMACLLCGTASGTFALMVKKQAKSLAGCLK